MFNRVSFHQTDVKHHTTIEEKRAPTDESVRLLKEFEEKALSKIDASIRLFNNTFECLIHGEKDYYNQQSVFLARYKLNGKSHKTKIIIDFYDIERLHDNHSKIRYIIEKVQTAIALDIAEEFLKFDIDNFERSFSEYFRPRPKPNNSSSPAV